MKNLSILTIAIFALLFTSCSKDEPELTLLDFAGTYTGTIDCTGALEGDKGESITIIVTTTGKDTYDIDLGDEVIFQGIQADNILKIDRQVLNEGGSFDVIRLEGDLQPDGDNFIFDFTHSVDDEGESECNMAMTKE